jgi:endo-1,3-1,4-beta-glycanase ExoK
MIRTRTTLALLFLTATIPATAMAMASAELYGTKAYVYGRFEARMRMAAGDGVVSSFFLWKEGSEASGAYWCELDLEKFGADCRLQTNARYGTSGTNHDQKHTVSGLCTAYHDYRMEWTSSYISWSVDNTEIRRDTGATATAFAQNATAGMTMHFNIWPGNSDFGGNINNTTLPVHQYISWIQYSSYDNGSFKQEWREEFQASGVPSGWAAGDWASPFNLSTHNTKNVNFVNGIAILSLTNDNATGNPGTPPTDPNAGGASGSGGVAGTGGATGSGGKSGSGGSVASGGSSGAAGAGGTVSSGGTTSTGTARGGAISSGGTSAAGGRTGGTTTTASGGSVASGGVSSKGGSSAQGGAAGTGGAQGLGGNVTASGGFLGDGGSSTESSGGNAGSGSGGATDSGGSSGQMGGSSGATAATDSGGCACGIGRSASGVQRALSLLALLALSVCARSRRKTRR